MSRTAKSHRLMRRTAKSNKLVMSQTRRAISTVPEMETA